MKKLATTFLILILLLIDLQAPLAQEKLPYQNPSLPIAKRVDDLVSRMTLEEKISQMMNGAAAIERLGVPEYDWWNEGLHGVARAQVSRLSFRKRLHWPRRGMKNLFAKSPT